MGCDGGSIPKRDELVKQKKKQERADQNELNRIRWFSCALSKEPLKPPVVTCDLGLLYNKEAIIRALINKTLATSQFNHIRSLKDVYDVKFKPNSSYNPDDEKMNISLNDYGKEAPFICPITGLEVGSQHKFSYIKTCGCAFSDRALTECPSDICLVCNKPFKKEDICRLNPNEEELKVLKEALKEKRSQEPEEPKREKKKKEKKRKKDSNNTDKLSKKLANESTKKSTSTPIHQKAPLLFTYSC